MSTTSAPFGLRAIYHPSGTTRPEEVYGALTSGYANNIFENTPVKYVSTGQIAPVAATSDEFIGTFAGVTYTPVNGRPTLSNYWPGGAVTQSGQDIMVYFTTDPWIEYEIQTDGTVAQANTISGGTNFTNLTAGSTGTGLSAVTATATIVTSGTAQMRITNLSPYQDNAWGDAFVILQVMIGLSQFAGNKAVI